VKLRTSIILAAAAVAALAASATASASPAGSTGHHPGSIIHATGVRPGAVTHIRSSTGALTVRPTKVYADLSSTNWSGYVTPGVSGNYTQTSTTFTVPAVTACGSSDTASAFWGGLDGWGDNTVEQDGVEDDCNGGVQSLYAWVETYPAVQLEIISNTTGNPAPVEPGDTFTATVAEISPSEYSMQLDDQTQSWSFAGDLEMPSGYTGEDLTSEVITEAPTECDPGCTQPPLTDFGTVGYSEAYYAAGTSAYYYGSANTTRIDLYENNSSVETDGVGALGSDGAFTITYGTLPPPPPPPPPPPAKPRPYQCERRATVIRVCWPAVAHATSYSGLLYKHGHSFTTASRNEVFRGLKRNTSYKLRMHASNAAGSSATVVLTVRTR
jgi:Peptidase A4 family